MDAVQLNIFGEEETVKTSNQKNAAKPEQKTKQQHGTKNQDELVPANTTVAYAGHQVVLERDMKLEEIREMLERDFPELSKERTQMIYDKEKGLVIPVVTGGKKG